MNWSPTFARPAKAERPGLASLADAAPSGKRPQLRPCRASWLDAGGNIDDSRFLIPAHPLFEAAFCAFARGTLVDTPNGPVAIEDILPGDLVMTAEGLAQPVTWIGSTTIVPATPSARAVPLYRILPDAFGMARPMSHLVTGPSARVLGQAGQSLTPIAAFEDGVQVTHLSPPSPVDLYHVCLEQHAMIRMGGGLAFESYHPGHGALRDVGPAMRDLFMKLFPQIGHVTDFGLMAHPRSQDPQDGISAA